MVPTASSPYTMSKWVAILASAKPMWDDSHFKHACRWPLSFALFSTWGRNNATTSASHLSPASISCFAAWTKVCAGFSATASCNRWPGRVFWASLSPSSNMDGER
eukprot:9273593-Alexandrium_andersonii.AAC.2